MNCHSCGLQFETNYRLRRHYISEKHKRKERSIVLLQQNRENRSDNSENENDSDRSDGNENHYDSSENEYVYDNSSVSSSVRHTSTYTSGECDSMYFEAWVSSYSVGRACSAILH